VIIVEQHQSLNLFLQEGIIGRLGRTIRKTEPLVRMAANREKKFATAVILAVKKAVLKGEMFLLPLIVGASIMFKQDQLAVAKVHNIAFVADVN
jgi:hypothetical protein